MMPLPEEKTGLRLPLKKRGAAASTDRAQLAREFKARLAQLEHEHVMRLMALFQEFKARAQSMRKAREL